MQGGDLTLQQRAVDLVDEKLLEYGSITPPSTYDRPMQWLFIICLPFGLYYFWVYWKMSKRARAYRLEDDGTLSTPEGTWSADHVVDIDMSRWVAKTGNARSTWTAKLILDDETSLLLDDYIYQDMHLIIGTYAHRFYPQDWTPLAKRVKNEDVECDEGSTDDITPSPDDESDQEE